MAAPMDDELPPWAPGAEFWLSRDESGGDLGLGSLIDFAAEPLEVLEATGAETPEEEPEGGRLRCIEGDHAAGCQR